MRGEVAVFVTLAPSWCFTIEAGYVAANNLCPSNKPKNACIRPFDTIISPRSHKKVPPYYNWKPISSLWWENKLCTHLSRSVLSIRLCPFSHLPGMQDLCIISFFYFFPWSFILKNKKSDGFQFLQISLDGLDLEGLKVPKTRFLGFWQKSCPFRYAFLVQHEVPMFFWFFLYFLPKQHVCKNLVLELWSKNLRMKVSLSHNISEKTSGMKLNFWTWLEVQESTKY